MVTSVIAADPVSSPFIVDSWGVEDGLPDSEAISVRQAKDGYLWIGTLHGLVRFDGNQFRVFNEMNTPGLPSDGIVFLYEDSHTNLWIGTQSSGLAVIQNGQIKSFENETAGIGAVTCAGEDSSGVLFYSENGFARYQNGHMEYLPGVHSLQLYLLAAHLSIPSKDGSVWRLWNGIIQKWKGNHLEKDFGPSPWANVPVRAVCEDEKGNLIVGTRGQGIFWFKSDGTFYHILRDDGLSSDFVLSLCLDNEGNLWAGTDSGGLDCVKRKIFQSPAELHPGNVKSVSQDAAGGLWMAYNAWGLSYWNSNAVADFGVGQASNAWTVLADSKNNIWAGTSTEGLFFLRTNRFFPVFMARNLGPEIFALFQSRDGRLWVGAKNGLGCWNGKNWKFFTAHDGLSGNAIRAIAEGTNGDLWIGTEKDGLNLFDGKKFTAITNGLPGADISCLYMDNSNVLWAGTAAHGLAQYENAKWQSYSTSDGLVSDSISYIIGDDAGNLWIGSNRGLMRISEKALVDANETNSFFCRVYGRADGLPTRECSSGSQPATIRARDGRLWFPTIEGVVSVDPYELKSNPRPPQVLIESVLVDKREQNTNPLNSAWSPSVVIPPGGEQLEIHYTALNFSAPQAVRFKYQLEGHENTWTDADGSRVARYTDLSPGFYRFHVKACNEDGVWNDAGAVMDVDVLPQFWQTGTFRTVVIVFVLAIIVGIVRYLSTQKLHRQVQVLKQQEALERERARIARDLHDQLGANLTQVALLGEMAEADKNLPDEVESHTRQISQTARETTRSLDEIVWAINPSNDTLEGLANYATKYASEYLSLAKLPCRVDVPAQLPAVGIPPEVRHNVFLAFKEAVHNVIKHAQASEVWIHLRVEPNQFILQVEDNGRGIGKQEASTRNGLRNMKRRLTDIGGDFSISPRAGGGTLVQLTVPLVMK